MPAKKNIKVKNLRSTRTGNQWLKFPQKSRKTSKSKKRVFYFIFAGLVFAALTFFFSTKIYQFIGVTTVSALKNGGVETDGSILNGENVNIAIVHVEDLSKKDSPVNHFYLANINLNDYKYRIYDFPVQEEFKAYLKDERLMLHDLYKVGNLDGRIFEDYLKQFVLRQFALGIDGYVVVDDSGYSKIKDSIGGTINYDDLSSIVRIKNTLKIPTLMATFNENAHTNFSWYDGVKFLSFIRSTSENSSYYKSVSKYALTDVTVWDKIWQEQYIDTGILKEQKKVLIINASQNPKIPGLASWGARVAENFGMGILDMQNALAEFDENMIITSNAELFSAKEIESAFDIEKVHYVNDYLNRYDINPLIKNADITLILRGF